MGDGSGGPPVTADNDSIAMDQRMPSDGERRRRRARDPRVTAAMSSHRTDDEPSNGGVPVLYIGGCQRSGSTLLDRMMSQAPGHVSAGEIVHLWSRGLSSNELCGCGERFADCPFWAEVGRLAFGGWGSVDVDLILRLQRRVDRNRYIFFMVFPALSPRYRRDLERYVGILDRLYRAIYAVGGGAIVDSSKHVSTAFLLRRVPSVRIRVVHLVRDSRGVAFSLLKKIRRPEVVDGEAFMFRASVSHSAFEWMAFNALFHLLAILGTPTKVVRYESLVGSPGDTITRILRSEGRADTGEITFVDGTTVTLGVDHTVAGNPMRFERGSFELKADQEWRTSMRPRDRRLTVSLTWPLLALYGYLRGDRP